MVTWRAAAVLEGRWDQVVWALACFRVGTEQIAWGPLMNYWHMPYVMLSNPLMRVHCKFATALGEGVLFWTYHWLRGKGDGLI